MGNCRLNEPNVLARWLDGTLDQDRVQDIDRHLLGGCAVCWSVLRFVGRLRELVGQRRTGGERSRARIVLDSDAIRTAIGIDCGPIGHREILIEMGPLEALLKLTDSSGSPLCRLDMLALDRAAFGPPSTPLALEILQEDGVVVRGTTGPDGRLCLPIKVRGEIRLEFRGSGLDPVGIAIEI